MIDVKDAICRCSKCGKLFGLGDIGVRYTLSDEYWEVECPHCKEWGYINIINYNTMSKIIKEGKLPVKRMTCDYCGCEFEYDKRDIDEFAVSDPMGIIHQYVVYCPHCDEEISLPDNILSEMKGEDIKSDFEEDVRALAKQYGLTVKSVEVE